MIDHGLFDEFRVYRSAGNLYLSSIGLKFTGLFVHQWSLCVQNFIKIDWLVFEPPLGIRNINVQNE